MTSETSYTDEECCDSRGFPQFRIGDVELKTPFVLAPMAEYTHSPFRRMVASFGGCGLYFSEMLDARRAVTQRGFHLQIYRLYSSDQPFIYQIMGGDPLIMAEAIELLRDIRDEKGQTAIGFDINMGCGAHWIRRKKAGVSLMSDFDRARAIVRACRKAAPGILTAKIRLGWEENFDHFLDFCRMIIDEGLDALTLHPRFANEHFKNRARWQYVKMLKENFSIPIIGSGDIETLDHVRRAFDQSGCDAIMIGRMLVQKPWLFRTIIDGKEPEINKLELLARYIRSLREFFPPQAALTRFKQFMAFFSRNYPFGHRMQIDIYHSQSFDDVWKVLDPDSRIQTPDH